MLEANPPMSPKPAITMHCHFCARPVSEFVRRSGVARRYDDALGVHHSTVERVLGEALQPAVHPGVDGSTKMCGV